MATRAYSTLFSCLHDEPEPIGSIGRGTHHSVCRAVAWRGVNLTPLDRPWIHDFAILWDEDHDERVIPVVEGLLMEGLLSPVLFVGERKGTLTVAVNDALLNGLFDLETYEKQVQKVCDATSGGDHWPVQVVTLDRESSSLSGTELGGLVNDAHDRVLTYLRSIDVLWGLGIKPYKRPVPVSP